MSIFTNGILIVTNKLIPKIYDARTYNIFILIRSQFKDNVALIEHERVHVRQFVSNPLFFGLLYRFSKKYRLKYELEAFRKQLSVEYSPACALRTAEMLSGNYNLNMTVAECLKLLEIK